MKTVGDKLEPFVVTGVRPGQPEDAFYTITDQSFEGKWKVIVYYPKDFTFVYMYNSTSNEFVLLENPYISIEPISIVSNEKTSKFYLPKRTLLDLESVINSLKRDFRSIFIGSAYKISTNCLWNNRTYYLDKILLTVKIEN